MPTPSIPPTQPPAPPDSDLEQISFYLGRVYYTYIGVLERVLAEVGLDRHLRPGMGNVLFALFEQDERTISEIALRLHVSRSAMTGMVRGMKGAGLVSTHRDREDGRAVRLRLTPLGRSLEPRCRQVSERVDEILCRGFSPQERDRFRNQLAAMLKSMTDEVSRRDAVAEPADDRSPE